MIEYIELRYIRSYEHCYLQLKPELNLFYGPNGVGKTTLLEAVGVMATTKSFRTSSLTEMVQHGHPAGKIRVGLKDQKELSLEIQPRVRKFFINEKNTSKHSDFFGQFSIIVLAPEHFQIVQGSRKERLSYIDFILAQLDPFYFDILKDHQKVLQQKKALWNLNLSKNTFLDQSWVWQEKHENLSNQIREKRQTLLQKIAPLFIHTYQEISQKKIETKMTYQIKTEEKDRIKLLTSEFYSQRILSGAHMDEVEISLDESRARSHASHGEKATLLLALKFAELDLLFEAKQGKVVFLLDDVGTTLDQVRRKQLFSKVSQTKCQSLVSTCDLYVEKEIEATCHSTHVFTDSKSSIHWNSTPL